MRPIAIAVFGSHSSTVKKIIEQLNAAGAKAYYGYPSGSVRNPLVVNWSQGGNKIREMQLMTAASVPTTRHSLAPVTGWIPRRAYHQEALDFTEPPAVGDFWTEPTFTNHEFRVHVMHDLAFRTQHKYWPDSRRLPLLKYGVPIRNHSLGWSFNPNPDFPGPVLDRVRNAARAAVRALGYDMGAVDVGLIEPDRPVVFEINTRPSMDEYTRAAYVEALLKLASQ